MTCIYLDQNKCHMLRKKSIRYSLNFYLRNNWVTCRWPALYILYGILCNDSDIMWSLSGGGGSWHFFPPGYVLGGIKNKQNYTASLKWSHGPQERVRNHSLPTGSSTWQWSALPGGLPTRPPDLLTLKQTNPTGNVPAVCNVSVPIQTNRSKSKCQNHHGQNKKNP